MDDPIIDCKGCPLAISYCYFSLRGSDGEITLLYQSPLMICQN